MIKETDQSERVKMYKKMDSIVISKSIIVPLYYDEVTRFVSKCKRDGDKQPTY